MTKIGVALIDDHVLLRKGLAGLVNSFDDYEVVSEAAQGDHWIQNLDTKKLPSIVLLDINMPGMDGYETAKWLKENHPQVLVLALSMYDNENAIIRMLRLGARGYILKDADPSELKAALDSVARKGFYYSELVTGRIMHAINKLDDDNSATKNLINLSEREIEFLKWACTELTYKEIAEKMFLSARTIDGYRDALFEKLKIKTRVGLAIYAIRNGIVNL